VQRGSLRLTVVALLALGALCAHMAVAAAGVALLLLVPLALATAGGVALLLAVAGNVAAATALVALLVGIAITGWGLGARLRAVAREMALLLAVVAGRSSLGRAVASDVARLAACGLYVSEPKRWCSRELEGKVTMQRQTKFQTKGKRRHKRDNKEEAGGKDISVAKTSPKCIFSHRLRQRLTECILRLHGRQRNSRNGETTSAVKISRNQQLRLTIVAGALCRGCHFDFFLGGGTVW
jgi:hypothetical protein